MSHPDYTPPAGRLTLGHTPHSGIPRDAATDRAAALAVAHRVGRNIGHLEALELLQMLGLAATGDDQ